MATSFGLFFSDILQQSQLAERKHVARYWLINTVATAVPLSAHPSPLVITTKLAAAIFGGGCTEEVFAGPVLPCGNTAILYNSMHIHMPTSPCSIHFYVFFLEVCQSLLRFHFQWYISVLNFCVVL